jgi:hypothetical protein
MKTKGWVLMAAMVLAVSVPAGADENEGWVSLFNGKDLSGWKLKPEGGPNGRI